MRKFFASLFLFLFFLISGPILLLSSFVFSYGNANFIKGVILPQSYEMVLPFLFEFSSDYVPELKRKEIPLEQVREAFPKATYIALGSQVFTEIGKGIESLISHPSTRNVLIDLKETKRLFTQTLLHAFEKLPIGVSSEQKPFVLQKMREELEITLPSEFSFDIANPFTKPLIITSPFLPYLPPIIVLLFFLPLILSALILWKSASRIFRYEAWAFIFAGLEAFGLFWLFRQFPLLLERAAPSGLNISETVKMAIEFFLSFPSKMLFGISLALVTVGIVFFILSFRLASKKQVVEENSQTPITIRPGKLRKGTDNGRIEE